MAKSEAWKRLADYDTALREEWGPVLIGIDECGRGAVGGPIAAGACCLPFDAVLPGLNDSKKMTRERRTELAAQIKAIAIAWDVQYIGPEEIDEKGLTWANRRVMARVARAVTSQIEEEVDLYIVDQAPSFALKPHLMMSKADGTSLSVAAASVLVKTERDAFMDRLADAYPLYGLREHHGYIIESHKEAIRRHGRVVGLHRFCYKLKGIGEDED